MMATHVDGVDEELEELNQPPKGSWYAMNGVILLICAILGFIAAMELSVEAYQLASDADAQFLCDVSANVSCSAVAQTWQAELLGFPNAYLGIAFEAAAIALGLALAGGVHFPRWYSWGVEVVYTGALAFALWLMGQSFFVIQILCPWCLLTFFTTWLMWAVMTRVLIRQGAFGQDGPLQRWVANGSDWVVIVLVTVALMAVVIVKYGPGMIG